MERLSEPKVKYQTWDELMNEQLDDQEFALRYLNGAYNDDDPRMFEIAAGRVMRHAGKEFVDVASAMPFLRSLGFEPKNVARPPQKPARLHAKRLPAPRAKTSVNAAAPR